MTPPSFQWPKRQRRRAPPTNPRIDFSHQPKLAEHHIKRAKRLLARFHYKLTTEEYAQLYSKQIGVCAICHREPGQKGFHIDHDHKTGYVRGLLCQKCNLGIGLLGDSLDNVAAALEYLLKSEKDQEARLIASYGTNSPTDGERRTIKGEERGDGEVTNDC